MNIVDVLRLHFYLLFLFLCISLKPAFAFDESNSFKNSEVTAIPADIKEIFPSATRIGQTDPNLATTPVYQLSQLLGYVFESDDFTNFIGFSGETINVLIGIDINGVFAGFKVLNHHEPIFLHGLGEQSMFDFIDQYKGHSIKERFIINAKDTSTPGITNFDGVTRATVSVMVINDTIIASALQVARAKLEGFAAATTVKIDTDFFEKLSFIQLIEQGHISHWQVSKEQSLKLASDVSNELVNAIEELAKDNDTVDISDFIELYFAFVNIPVIGKNLLGEEEYQRLLESLKPGEHALMIFNRGAYSYASEDFIPQTVPARLSVVQGEFPVDIRDIDFYSYYDPSFNIQIPDFEQQNIFRIKSQSGFEISQAFEVSLAVNYSQSFLSTQQHQFTTNLVLPEKLFYTPKVVIVKKQPLWVRIWLSRTVEIAVLSLYLIILSLLFLKQKQLASHVNATHRIRFTMLIFTIFYIGYYTQGQLSVVNIYTLLLSLVNGFRLEVFLLDPVIFILWVFVFISLFLFGRGLFCGWLCPFGALQEMMGLLAKKLSIRQIKISPKHHKYAQKIKYIILFLLVGTSFYSLSLAEKLAEIEPFKTSITLNFVRYWPFVLYSVLLLLLSLKIHKFYCRYLCPLGAGLAIIGRFPLLKWLRRRKECGSPCQLCRNKKCDIDAINQNGSIDYGECIQCLECLVTIESPKLCVVHKYSTRPIKIKKVA
ncbi:4Fe-4S binding protein [Candidatus Colwellia aromaticivorans]|uniref:4Fe-4S binding protein n=1 Tax=Candidatus Colwellia aromaticivorans TaxID=2267621 RepID=UPI000DF14807|nr:4Fe-4S binding protein [Candidatus Colwellia aromaticivorans]